MQHFIDESLRDYTAMRSEENPAFHEYLEQYAELPRIYIKEGIRDTEQQFDHRFGVYHNLDNDSFSIGDSKLVFDGADKVVKGVRYKGTRDLYELLFKNSPIGIQKQTLTNISIY